MNIHQGVISDKYEPCVQVVRRLRNLSGFQFLEEDEFIELILQIIDSQNSPKITDNIQNVALNIYAKALYSAATEKDLLRNEECFQELSKYLYRMAYNFYLHASLSYEEKLEKAEESTQSALEKIYSHLHTVKAPGGFLKWCGVVLRNTCLEEIRGRKEETSLDEIEEKARDPISDGQRSIENDNEKDCLKEAIFRLKPEYQQVIIFTYFSLRDNGTKWTDQEIAAQLRISVGNLYTIRSRALSLLRKDSKLVDCFQNSM